MAMMSARTRGRNSVTRLRAGQMPEIRAVMSGGSVYAVGAHFLYPAAE